MNAPGEPGAQAVFERDGVEQGEGGGPFAGVPEIHHRAVAFGGVAHIDARRDGKAGTQNAQKRERAHVVQAADFFVGRDQHGQVAGEIAVARREHGIETGLPVDRNLVEGGVKMPGQFRGQIVNGSFLISHSKDVIDGGGNARFQGEMPNGLTGIFLDGKFIRFLGEAEAINDVICRGINKEQAVIFHFREGKSRGGIRVPRNAPTPVWMAGSGGGDVDLQLKGLRGGTVVGHDDVKQQGALSVRHPDGGLDAEISRGGGAQNLISEPTGLVEDRRLAVNQEAAGIGGQRDGGEAEVADGQGIARAFAGTEGIVEGGEGKEIGSDLPVAGQFVEGGDIG